MIISTLLRFFQEKSNFLNLNQIIIDYHRLIDWKNNLFHQLQLIIHNLIRFISKTDYNFFNRLKSQSNQIRLRDY